MSRDRFHAMIAGSHFHTQDWGKLSATEQTIAERFVHEHWHRPLSERSVLIDRLFTDDPAKPRHWSIVVQLLASFNTSEICPKCVCPECGTPMEEGVCQPCFEAFGFGHGGHE